MLLAVIIVLAQEPMNPWGILSGDQLAARSDRND
jgi:hypothetical protein